MTVEELFTEVDTAFEKSDIKKFADSNKYQWNYSLTSTPIYHNGLLLVGFNGGAIQNYPYIRPKEVPPDNFLQQDLGSFRRVVPFLKKYFSDDTIAKIVQTNYCFFRSSKESEISDGDKKLCEPIFFKLLSFINPNQVISFSASLRKHLTLHPDIFQIKFSNDISSNKGIINAAVGELKINSRNIPIGFLPHPNYPLNKSARENAWNFVMQNLN